MKPIVLLMPVALLAGCGPYVSETRQTSFPPRPPACELEVIHNLPVQDYSSGGPWTVAGYVNVSDTGEMDPLSDDNRELVRPRACSMGGEAITLMSANNQGMIGSGGGTIYVVLRSTASSTPRTERL